MCTVILLSRPGHEWPLMLAANRDERLERPWDAPAAWWPDRPGVVAGRDRLADGTWMGINRAGVVATVLNRPGALGPAPGKRTRGILPLLGLEYTSAGEAAAAIARLDAADWRPFNMVIADREQALFVRGTGRDRPDVVRMEPGTVHMVTSHDPDDRTSPRVARHLPRFRAASTPEPGRPEGWESWRALLADTGGSTAQQIAILPRDGYGTASAALLALSEAGAAEWLFAAGLPALGAFQPLVLA